MSASNVAMQSAALPPPLTRTPATATPRPAVMWFVAMCRYVDAALYLTELQADGVLGAVGVTNFDVPRLEAMLNKGAQLVSNQVRGVHRAAVVVAAGC